MLIYLACAIALFAAAGCRTTDNSWDRINESGVLLVGIDPTYPPFESLDRNSIIGLDVDMLQAIADKYDLETEFKVVSYDGLYEALASGKVDMLISALVIHLEQTRDFAYSDGYFDAGEILVTRADETEVEVVEDLRGKDVAVELGAQGHVEAINYSRKLQNLGIVTYSSAAEALEAVANGDADAAIVDAISGRLFLSTAPGLTRAKEPVTSEPFVIVVRNEDKTLLSKINDALATMKDSGQLDQIIDRWLPAPETN